MLLFALLAGIALGVFLDRKLLIRLPFVGLRSGKNNSTPANGQPPRGLTDRALTKFMDIFFKPKRDDHGKD